MNEQLLKPGQKIHLDATGLDCTVAQFITAGGQGGVYRMHVGDRDLALKWYHPRYVRADPLLKERIERITRTAPPNDRFLWPMELASAKKVPAFGYVMPFRERRFRSVRELVDCEVYPTYRVLTTAAMHLADSYFQLHAPGLCYRDISFENCSLDPDTGDIVILDNDNVDYAGAEVGVVGTLPFMAPELVRYFAARNGWAGSMEDLRHPVKTSIYTDLHSLAVLLFYMFMLHHPLLGRREAEIGMLDNEDFARLLGFEPVFIFDPEDTSNAPDQECQSNALVNWAIYPRFLRERFTRAFTEGLRDPENGRVRETEWRMAMVRLRNSIVDCPYCGLENFADVVERNEPATASIPCWSCSRTFPLPPRLRIRNAEVVMLNQDTKLYPHHLDASRMYDFSAPVAEMVRHPQRPDVWGLKNLTGQKWTITPIGGAVEDVVPGKSVRIAPGTRVHFGNSDAEILQ